MTSEQCNMVCYLAIIAMIALMFTVESCCRKDLYSPCIKTPDEIQRIEERLDRLEAKLEIKDAS